VQARLAHDEEDLIDEIEALQEELRLQQDPGKMQLIQEMISVRDDKVCIGKLLKVAVGPTRPDVSYPREGDRIRSYCSQYYQGYTSPRPCQGEPHP
jgi:hypothetical protein